MVPQQVMASEELQSRANSLRLQAAQGVATPLPPTVGPVAAGVYGQPPLPASPIDPTYQPAPGGIISSPAPSDSGWQPGSLIQEFIMPGGALPTRIPEAGILPGGGYRPEM